MHVLVLLSGLVIANGKNEDEAYSLWALIVPNHWWTLGVELSKGMIRGSVSCLRQRMKRWLTHLPVATG